MPDETSKAIATRAVQKERREGRRSNTQLWSFVAHVVGMQALTFIMKFGVQKLETEPRAWVRKQVVYWLVVSLESEVCAWD